MYASFKNERSIQVWREANNAHGMKQFKGSSYPFTQIISTKPLKLAVKKNKECIRKEGSAPTTKKKRTT